MMFTLLLTILFTYINTPVATMRSEPTDKSKIESQAVYAEQVTIKENKDRWVKIATQDNEEGWVKKRNLFSTEKKLFENAKSIATVCRSTAHVYHVKDTEYGPILSLPFESKLEVLDEFGEPNGRWLQVKLVNGKSAYIQRGDVSLQTKILNKDEAVQFSKQFLGLPYTWGGRSSFGYDCSGFVQMLYRQMGVAIPRNSRQQAAWKGFKETTVENLQPADLVFFWKKNAPISHVGFYIGNGEFIHASVRENAPYIHISQLNKSLWDNPEEYSRTFRTLATHE